MQVLTLFQEIFAVLGTPVRAWTSFLTLKKT